MKIQLTQACRIAIDGQVAHDYPINKVLEVDSKLAAILMNTHRAKVYDAPTKAKKKKTAKDRETI